MNEHAKWMWNLLGAAISAAALVSLIQGRFDVELSEVFLLYLNYYRDVSSTLLGFVPRLFSWSLPSWYVDIGCIVGMVTANVVKTNNTTKSVASEAHKESPGPWWSDILAIYLSMLFVPLGVLVTSIYVYRAIYDVLHYREYQENGIGEFSKWAAVSLITLVKYIGLTLVLTVAFFVASGKLSP